MQVKLQAGVQLPPITQRLVFYEQVELESQALEKRRGELMSKLTTLSEKRKEVEAKWDQVCAVQVLSRRFGAASVCPCRYTYIRNSLCRIITISIKGCIQFFVVPRFHEKETARAGCQQVEAVQSKEEGNGRAEGYSAPG